MSKKKQMGLTAGLAVAVVVVIAALAWAAFLFWPSKTVKTLESRLAEQASTEQAFKNIDARLDDPKVVVNPYGLSPLSALVMFKTDQPVAATVKIVGKDDLSTFSHTFAVETEHRLPVYGLYAGQTNTVEITAGDTVKRLEIQTEALPADFPKTLDVKKEAVALTNDLYFVTPSSGDGRTSAYDVNGDVRWYLTGRFSWEVKRLKNGHMLLGSGRILAEPYYLASAYEIDMLGKIYAEYYIPGYHHDYYERDNGNIIAAANNMGRQSGSTVEDTVVEIDRRTGKIVKTVDLSETLPHKGGDSLDWSAGDWFHNNSVDLNEQTGELILSGRHKDAVVNLDYNTGKLNYIIGDPDTWPADMQPYFLKPVGEPFEWQWEQHAATFLPNGDIMLFDNGTWRSKHKETALAAPQNYSRAVIYRVDKSAGTISQVWQYGKERGAEYFSPYVSDADYLDEGHTLVHSGGVSSKDGVPQNGPAGSVKADTLHSFTTEVKNDQVVFELKLAANFYRAEKMSLYYENEGSLKLGEAKALGQLPATKMQRWDLPLSSVRPVDQTFKNTDLKLEREVDRLIIKGKFHENDVIQLVLKKGSESWRMRLPLKAEVFSNAACIDIFDTTQPRGGEVDVTQYVNGTGLSGSYDIYLQLNGRLYKTGQRVQF